MQLLKERFPKKWKFLMAFAMRAGGGLASHYRFFQKCFFKTIQNHSLTVKTCFAHSLGFILYTYSSWGDQEFFRTFLTSIHFWICHQNVVPSETWSWFQLNVHLGLRMLYVVFEIIRMAPQALSMRFNSSQELCLSTKHFCSWYLNYWWKKHFPTSSLPT